MMETSQSVNLSACLNRLQQKLSEAVILDQDYIPVRGTWNAARSNADFDLDEQLDKFIAGEQKVLLLLGDSGAGKSLFCQQLQQRLLQQYITDSTNLTLPLFIPLPSSKDPVHHVIETTLQNYGCSVEEIALLKKSQKFIFILDGYDEIRQTKNLYVTNHLKDWQAKVIITCRSQYLLTLDYHAPYFMPYEGQKPQGWLLSEVVVKPFNQKQIDAYLQQYVKHHLTEWNDWKKYQQAIEDMPDLKALIQTPFLLKLAVEEMPNIVSLYENLAEKNQSKNLTQAKLYDVFVEQWFMRQEEKLKTNGQLKNDETIKPKLWAYAQGLAKAMHQAQVTQITYEGNQDLFAESDSKNPWEQFFSDDAETQLIRHASLLRKVGEHQYAFFHASLIEYFVSTEIHYQEQQISEVNISLSYKKINTGDVQQKLNIDRNDTSEEQKIFNQKNYYTSTTIPAHYHYFYRHLLTKERGMLQFFADRVQEDVCFKQDLFKIIEGSKYDEAMHIAAANAITILNKANVSFGMQNFAGIRIPHADLSYSNCDHTNFKGADLTGVNFTQAWLRKANLSFTQMVDVEFGQLPAIQHEHRVTALAYNPNDKSIVTVDKNKLIVWDVQTQDKLHELDTGEEWIYSVAFSPNGETIAAGGEGKEVVVWNLITQEVKRLALDGAINSVVFSREGNRILAGGEEGKLILWNFIKNTFEIIGHYPAAINAMAFSQNSNYLAASCRNDIIYFYNVFTQVTKELSDHKAAISCLAFSPHNQSLASGSIDGEIRLWSLVNEDCQVFHWHHELPVLTLAFSPDSTQLASAGNTEAICICNLYTHDIQFFPGHNSNINALAYSPNGQSIISGSDDATVRTWQLAGNTLSAFNERHNQYIGRFCFSNAGDLLALTNRYEKTIQIHTLATGKVQILSCDNLKNPIIFTPDDKHILIASEGKLLQWNLLTNQSQCIDQHKDGLIISIAASANGQWIASGSDHIRLLESSTGKAIPLIYNYKESTTIDAIFKNNLSEVVYTLSFSPDSLQLASAGRDGIIRLWDLMTHQPILLKGHTDTIRALKYSPNGQWLASLADDHTLRLWSLTNKQNQIISWINVLGKISFSPDSKYLLASSQKGYIGLFEVETGRCRGQLQGLQETLTDINFVPRTEYEFVTGNFMGRLNHWRLLIADSYFSTFDWQLLKSNQPMIFETADVEHEQNIGLSTLRYKLLEKAVTPYDPNQDSSYLSEIGAVKAYFGRCQEAIDDLTKAIELNPKKASNYFERGLSKRRLGHYEEAIADLDKALALYPKYFSAYNTRGLCKDELGHNEEAIQDYNKALEINPRDSAVFYNRGVVKKSLGRFEDAIEDFDKVIELNPIYSVAYNERGMCKDNLNRYEEGIQDFNKAIELDPKNSIYFNNRAFAKTCLSCYEEAIKDYDKAIEINPSNANYFNNRGNSKDELNCYEEAIKDYDKAIELNPNDADYFYNRGTAKDSLGYYEEAILDYDYAIELTPENAKYFNNRGFAKYNLDRYEEAIADYDKAIELNPNDADYYNNRGDTKDSLGRYEEAIADYDKAIKLDPADPSYFNNRGISKRKLGRYEEAIEDYNYAIRLNPKKAGYFNSRAFAKDSLGRYEEAIADYDKAVELNPKDTNVLKNRGVSKRKLGQYEASIKDYTRAIELNPKDFNAFFWRAWSKHFLMQYEAAIEDNNQAIALNPNYSNAYNDRGLFKDNLGQYEAAIQDYDQAILLKSNDAIYYSKRGLAKARLNQTQEALVDSEQALALASNKNDVVIQGRYAVVWAYQGNEEKARQHLAEINAETKDLYQKYYFNGWVELLLHNYQVAVNYFDKFLAEKVELPYYLAASLMLRGKAYAELGNYGQARLDMEAALKQIPNHQEWQQWYQEIFGEPAISAIKKSAGEKISNHKESNKLNEKIISSDERLSEIEKLGEYEFLPSKNNTADNVEITKVVVNINENIQKNDSFAVPTKISKIKTIITKLAELSNHKKSYTTAIDSELEVKTQHTIKNTSQFWQKLGEKNNENKINNISKNEILDENIVRYKHETICLDEEIIYLSLNDSIQNFTSLNTSQNKINLSHESKNADVNKKLDYQEFSTIGEVSKENTQTSSLQQRLRFWREKESSIQANSHTINNKKQIQAFDTKTQTLNK